MTTAARPMPVKLVREEAKLGTLQCLACGGPITLRGYGGVEQIVCPYCGSELKPEHGESLELLRAANRQRLKSQLALHQRGSLDGITWDIIGIVWRQCVVDGTAYPWQEFLLFNPYEGYRYLIYSMSDGHWSFGHPLDYVPREKKGFGHPRLEAMGERYKHFQTVTATVTYVEGEFPWQVHVGDTAEAREYVAPPFSISVEQEASDGGADINFTKQRHINAKDVWRAFECEGMPPLCSGIAPNQPNPWVKGRKTTWLSMLGLLVLWGVTTGFYMAQVDPRTVLTRELPLVDAMAEPIAESITIGEPGERTTVEFELEAPLLSNGWAYTEVLLVSQDSEDAYGFGVTVDEWHGVSDGESWSEGDTVGSVVLGGVPGGSYHVQLTTTAGGADAAAPSPPGATMLAITLREDVVLLRYVLLPLLFILGIPLLFGLFRLSYEARRWKNSDYTSS